MKNRASFFRALTVFILTLVAGLWFYLSNSSRNKHVNTSKKPETPSTSFEAQFAKKPSQVELLFPLNSEVSDAFKTHNVIMAKYLNALRSKPDKSVQDFALLALNSVGAERENLIQQWSAADPDNAAPRLLSAIDLAREGNVTGAMALTRQAMQLGNLEDYCSLNMITQAEYLAESTNDSVQKVYLLLSSDAQPGYYLSVHPDTQKLGEILVGAMLEPGYTPKEEDRENWAAALALSVKTSDALFQTIYGRSRALDMERDLIARLPQQFESVIDRSKSQYIQELTAEISRNNEGMRRELGLYEGDEDKLIKYFSLSKQIGPLKALFDPNPNGKNGK